MHLWYFTPNVKWNDMKVCKINYLSSVKSRRKQTNCPTVSTFAQIHHSVNSLQWLCSDCRYLMFSLCIVSCLGAVHWAVHCTVCTVWLAVTEAGVSSWLCKPRPGRRRTVSSSVARDVIVQSYEITATSHPPTFVMKQSFHTAVVLCLGV